MQSAAVVLKGFPKVSKYQLAQTSSEKNAKK
jgi:hypothetical protein